MNNRIVTDTTLVFDYDGTIHNTMTIYEPAIRETYGWLLEHGYTTDEAPSSERIASWLGMNAREMWLDFMPYLDEEVREQASAMVGSSMLKQLSSHKSRWYEGAAVVLDTLKSMGYSMVILSNSKKQDGVAHFAEFGMEKWFERWYDCESFDWAPKTDIIKEVAKDYPGKLIVIGDRKSDIDAAVTIGVTSVGCCYGYGTKDELSMATYRINNLNELINILGRL